MFNETKKLKVKIPNGATFIEIEVEVKYTSSTLVTEEHLQQLIKLIEDFIKSILKYVTKYSPKVLADGIMQGIYNKLKEIKCPIRPYEIKVNNIKEILRNQEIER